MSAPKIVFLLVGEAAQYTNPNRRGTAGLKYLRADLTCGECAKQGKHNECPHDYVNHDAVMPSAAKHVWPNHGVPACMAFVPKVKP